MARIIKILFILILFTSLINAQKFLVKNYTEEDGLLDPKVNDINQDHLGRLWVGSKSGLSIYDGSNWKHYNNTNGLIFQNVEQIRFDEDQNPWLVSCNNNIAIFYLKNGKWENLSNHFLGTYPNYYTSGFELIKNGNDYTFVIGTQTDGIFVFSNGSWQNFTRINKQNVSEVLSVNKIDKEIFVTTKNGVFKYQNNSFVKTNIFDDAGNRIYKIVYEEKKSEKKIWVLGSKYLGYYKNNVFHPLKDISSYSNVYENYKAGEKFFYSTPRLIPDFYGNVIINFYQFILVFHENFEKVTRLGIKFGLNQFSANSVFVDREKNVWVGGVRGLSKISSFRFLFLNKEAGLYDDEVSAINELSPGKIVFGHNDGLTVLDNGEYKSIEIKSTNELAIGDKRILDLESDGKGNLYFAAGRAGFGRLNKNLTISYLATGENYKGALSLAFNSKKELYATTSQKLFKIIGNRIFKVSSFDEIKEKYLRKIFFDQNDIIHIVTASRGVAYYKNNEWKFL